MNETSSKNDITSIISKAMVLKRKADASTTVEEAQAYVANLKLLLKEVSRLQSTLGTIHNEAKASVGSFRKSKPKPKPTEGEIKTLKGQDYIFVDQSWFKYGGEKKE